MKWASATFSQKGHDFFKQFIDRKICFDFIYNFFLTFLILRRTERDIIKNVYGLHGSACYSSRILKKLEFSRQIFEK